MSKNFYHECPVRSAGAASKLRELIRLGGEAITLLADLDTGATGSMTGGGFADGSRPIIIDPLVLRWGR